MVERSMRVQRQPSPVRAQVTQILRQAIRDMRFKPGERLVERELIELTGVSRTSIREAIRELAAEGLVQSIPNRGTVVAGLTPDEARQLYELRSCLEGLAGRLFVQRATDEQVAELRRTFDSMKESVQLGVGLLEAKDDFYNVLFEGTGNDALRSVVSGLLARIRVMRAVSLAQPNRPAETVGEIQLIVEAVERRDAEAAARACSSHVEQAAKIAVAAVSKNHQRLTGA
jgi:GntR family transcriptional regulator, trigonelline degradation regulator